MKDIKIETSPKGTLKKLYYDGPLEPALGQEQSKQRTGPVHPTCFHTFIYSLTHPFICSIHLFDKYVSRTLVQNWLKYDASKQLSPSFRSSLVTEACKASEKLLCLLLLYKMNLEVIWREAKHRRRKFRISKTGIVRPCYLSTLGGNG